MIEVHVADDELAIGRQQVSDLRELPRVTLGEVLEESLGHDEVERRLFGGDRLL